MNRVAIGLAAALSACIVAACGSSSTSTPPPTATADITTTPTPTTSVPTPTASATAGALSGKWSGQYSGVFNGTFTLNWQQGQSDLSGTIAVTSPPGTLNITGTVVGDAIQFGAVGGVAYSGVVSGNSMSGTYRVPNRGTGSWNATRSS